MPHITALGRYGRGKPGILTFGLGVMGVSLAIPSILENNTGVTLASSIAMPDVTPLEELVNTKLAEKMPKMGVVPHELNTSVSNTVGSTRSNALSEAVSVAQSSQPHYGMEMEAPKSRKELLGKHAASKISYDDINFDSEVTTSEDARAQTESIRSLLRDPVDVKITTHSTLESALKLQRAFCFDYPRNIILNPPTDKNEAAAVLEDIKMASQYLVEIDGAIKVYVEKHNTEYDAHFLLPSSWLMNNFSHFVRNVNMAQDSEAACSISSGLLTRVPSSEGSVNTILRNKMDTILGEHKELFTYYNQLAYEANPETSSTNDYSGYSEPSLEQRVQEAIKEFAESRVAFMNSPVVVEMQRASELEATNTLISEIEANHILSNETARSVCSRLQEEMKHLSTKGLAACNELVDDCTKSYNEAKAWEWRKRLMFVAGIFGSIWCLDHFSGKSILWQMTVGAGKKIIEVVSGSKSVIATAPSIVNITVAAAKETDPLVNPSTAMGALIGAGLVRILSSASKLLKQAPITRIKFK